MSTHSYKQHRAGHRSTTKTRCYYKIPEKPYCVTDKVLGSSGSVSKVNITRATKIIIVIICMHFTSLLGLLTCEVAKSMTEHVTYHSLYNRTGTLASIIAPVLSLPTVMVTWKGHWIQSPHLETIQQLFNTSILIFYAFYIDL